MEGGSYTALVKRRLLAFTFPTKRREDITGRVGLVDAGVKSWPDHTPSV